MIHKEIHKSQDKHETSLAVQRLSKTGGVGSITGQGAKILQAWVPKSHRSYVVTNSIKISKLVHIKKTFKKQRIMGLTCLS